MSLGRRLTSLAIVAALCGLAPRASAQPKPSDPDWKDEPAKAADPPLLPAPQPQQQSGPPLSTSGTDLVPGDHAASTTPPPIVVEDKDEAARREARMRQLEERVAADERRIRRLDERTKLLRHLHFGGYVQPQLLIQSYNTAASPNLQPNGELPPGIGANDVVAKPDGTTTNGTFFRMRRTRLQTWYDTDIAKFYVQIDVLPFGGVGPGIGTIVRNAEATGIAKWTKDVRTEVTAGVFLTPFRAEILEVSKSRPFIERSWYVENCFPAVRDIGVHARTFANNDKFQFDIAIVNGQRLGERYFVAEPDLNKSKDLVTTMTYRLGHLTLGVNGYLGRGQLVDTQSLRFKQFRTWALNGQANYRRKFVKRLGETRLIGELAVSQNMDTGINYSFARPRMPVNIADDVGDVDERGLYARLEQDLSPWLMVGYRYDFYSPDTAVKNNARDTHAWLAVVRFSQNLRWMNELDWAIDNVHDPALSPTSRHIVSFSTVLQAGF